MKNMTEQKAKQILRDFTKNQVLTFTVETFEKDEEWIARCDQIPAIITGGVGNDYNIMYSLMRDAVLTAAGIDSKYADCIYDASLKSQAKQSGGEEKISSNKFSQNKPKTQFTVMA